MSSPSANPLQPHHLRNLILILHRANARYSQLASCVRASLAPSHHAKTRAQTLNLTVDITAAVNCPQSAVSIIPLPIIEIASPLPIVHRRPVLTCTIPVTRTITSPNGTTSALSAGSAYSVVTLTSGKTTNGPRSHWSTVTDDDDFPRNVTDPGAHIVRAAEQTKPVFRAQPLDVPIDEDVMIWDLDLQYPEDSSCMDISPCASASSTVAIISPISPSSGSEAGSESSDSSAGPITPPSTLPLMIRIKRKSMEVHDADEIDSYNMSDKRVRVFHADPTQTQRRNVIRIPARK